MTERELFIAARRLDGAADRAALLAQECGGDMVLRRQVEMLLGEQEGLGGFLERPALDADDAPVGPGSVAEATEISGTMIGPYKLLEQIGEGGFGVVYMAEQQQPVRRKVAVKVIKPGMDSRLVIARFEAERQALALMEHPNIAKVLDGGTVPPGAHTTGLANLPYFVMELVRGIPITEYCDRNNLPPRRRLELFVSVCRAVQHAHQKGVIHRDLKPTNVLVTLHDGLPVPKLIDFGIAKAIGQQLTEKTLFTGFAQMIGSPLYMSPEQAELSGLDIDTRADIYALGVLLYELLTGKTPFDSERLRTVSYDEMRRIIREEEPPRPSARLTTQGQATATVSALRQIHPRQLSTVLRGELDWIVMKALDKDRSRRYESAAAFAADVERYMREEPVEAGPPTAWYRWRKFARRHRSALAMTAVMISAIILGIAAVGGSIGWIARDQAARQRELNQEVGHALDGAEELLASGNWPNAKPTLEHARVLLAAVADRSEQSARLHELIRDAAMAERLEGIYSSAGNQGLPNEIELNLAYTNALRDYGIDLATLSVAAAAQRMQASSIRMELAQALDFWSGPRSRVALGRPTYMELLALAKEVDPDEWRNQVRTAVERADFKQLEAMAQDADVRQLPARSLNLLARALKYPLFRGPYSRTWEVNDDRVTAFLQRAQRQYPGDLWINVTLGDCLMLNKNGDDALPFYTAAFAVRPNNHSIASRIGFVFWSKRAYPDAVVAFTKAIELRSDDENSWMMRGMSNLNADRYDESIADHTETLALNPRNPLARWGRGLALERRGQWNRAAADYSTIIEQHPKLKGPSISEVRSHRTWAYSMIGDWDSAATDLAPQGAGAPASDDVQFQLACLCVLKDDRSGFENIRKSREEHLAASTVPLTTATAACSCRIHALRPIVATTSELAPGWAELTHTGEQKGADSLHVQALVLYRADRFEAAIGCCQESMNANPRWDGNPQNWLLIGLAYQRLGQIEKARPWLDKARSWRKDMVAGKRQPGTDYSPTTTLSDWLEFQVLYRETETLLGEGQLPRQAAGCDK
jgi:serine/threonine protein kinase/tetratricopeptide (TPR) repeat protein